MAEGVGGSVGQAFRRGVPIEPAQTWSSVFQEDWERGLVRKFIADVTSAKPFEFLIAAVLFANLVVIVCDTDATADGNHSPEVLDRLSHAFIYCYVVEIALKLFAYRAVFFHEWFNVADFSIIAFDLFFLIAENARGIKIATSTSFLRLFRLLKVARAIKLVTMFGELRRLILAVTGAVRAVFWGTLMLTVLILIWSIIAVQVLHPIGKDLADECPECAFYYRSVWFSSLTITQTMVTGDSWGASALPFIKEKPITLLYFGGAFLSICLTLMNIILALIVDGAAEIRETDAHEAAMRKEKLMQDVKSRLVAICDALDTDHTGTLSINEFKKGFEDQREFADLLKLIDVTKEHLTDVFAVLDNDGSGDIDYIEFVENLYRMRSAQGQLTLFYVTEIRDLCQRLLAQTPDGKAEGVHSRSMTLKPGSRSNSGNSEARPLHEAAADGNAQKYQLSQAATDGNPRDPKSSKAVAVNNLDEHECFKPATFETVTNDIESALERTVWTPATLVCESSATAFEASAQPQQTRQRSRDFASMPKPLPHNPPSVPPFPSPQSLTGSYVPNRSPDSATVCIIDHNEMRPRQLDA